MTIEHRTPTVADMLARLRRDVDRLQRQLSQVIDARRTPLFISFAGFVADMVGIESMPMRTVHPTEIDLIVPQVLAAPIGADITIDLTLHGITTGVVRTLTIPDGQFYSEDAVPFFIPMGGALTATVTAADGGSASDLAVAFVPKLL